MEYEHVIEELSEPMGDIPYELFQASVTILMAAAPSVGNGRWCLSNGFFSGKKIIVYQYQAPPQNC